MRFINIAYHHPEVVARNPNRTVPVLVDDDVSIYDSTVILEYLEDRYPKPALYPADSTDRARCRQLERFADENIFPGVWDLIENTLYPPTESGRDPERAARARGDLTARFETIDAELGDRNFLCGGDFSVADIGVFVMVNAAATLGWAPDAALSAITAWNARVRERPVVANEMAEMTAYLGRAMNPSEAS